MSYIGIDNGVSGTIGILGAPISPQFIYTPVKSELNYTKKKSNITRINTSLLKSTLSQFKPKMVLIERPMVNPSRFQATSSALRALEATLIVLEELNLPYQYIDSKEWQKELLPSGIKGSANLKEASKQIGCRLFPEFCSEIEEHGDADGLLIAEYCRRHYAI